MELELELRIELARFGAATRPSGSITLFVFAPAPVSACPAAKCIIISGATFQAAARERLRQAPSIHSEADRPPSARRDSNEPEATQWKPPRPGRFGPLILAPTTCPRRPVGAGETNSLAVAKFT